MPSRRVSTGVSALDAALEGGLPPLRATLVTGDSGAGKTTLALQFLETGARAGEPGLFVALDQKPAHVREAAARFGWVAGADDIVTVLDGSPAMALMRQGREGQSPIDARAVMSDLVPHLRSLGVGRLVIDALPALVPPGLSESAETAFLRDLVFALEDNAGCTTLLVAADGDPRASRISAVTARLVTGVIDLRAREEAGRLRRFVLVRKMRATAADPVEREFAIGASGVTIAPV